MVDFHNGVTCQPSPLCKSHHLPLGLTVMFLADRNIRQLPCGHPGCNRYFKTSAGRTKHRHAQHPIITPSDPPQILTPSLPSSTGSEELNPLSDNGMESGWGGPPTPLHTIDSQFYGPGDKLYRNYHPKLTGNVTCFVIVLVGLLMSKIQQGHAMNKVNSLPLGPLQLRSLLTQTTGLLSIITCSLKQLTYYTPASKCRRHKSTP